MSLRRLLSLFLIVLMASCGITKRKYRPGWYISTHKHVSHQEVMQEKEPTPELPEQDRKIFQDHPLPEMTNIDSLQIINKTSEAEFIPVDAVTDERLPGIETIPPTEPDFLPEKNSPSVTEKGWSPMKEMSKGWKIFWITVLCLVLFAAFIGCGAQWPEVYIIWLGLTSLLALLGISSSVAPGSWGERIGLFFTFIALAGFYYLIYYLAMSFWSAVLLQLIVYAGLVLLALLITLIVQRIKKKK